MSSSRVSRCVATVVEITSRRGSSLGFKLNPSFGGLNDISIVEVLRRLGGEPFSGGAGELSRRDHPLPSSRGTWRAERQERRQNAKRQRVAEEARRQRGRWKHRYRKSAPAR